MSSCVGPDTDQNTNDNTDQNTNDNTDQNTNNDTDHCSEYHASTCSREQGSLNMVTETTDVYSPEQFVISNSLYNVKVSPEIRGITNKNFCKFLNEILSVILFQLMKLEKKDNIEINVELSRDLEVPEWREFVITIKLLSMDYMDDKEFFSLWKKIDGSVRDRISSIKDVDKEVLEKYGKLIIILEKDE
jgi:hypothetical protein